MQTEAFKTHAIQRDEPLLEIFDRYLPRLKEKSIVAVTSKIVSVCQNCMVSKTDFPDKYVLITQEADAFLAEEEAAYGAHLTIKNNILIPSAGIDESNAQESYILYPKAIQSTATEIWQYLRQKHDLKQLGIVITDSHTTPLRRGVTGISIGWCGFDALRNYVGEPDIYGKPLRITQMNVADALAGIAVFIMGEGGEQTPLALIEHAPHVQFCDHPPTSEELQRLNIPLEEDLYAPLLMKAAWKKPSRM